MAEMSPLRRHMIEDMTVRNLSPATQRPYVSAIAKFSRYFGRSPDRLDLEDVRAFQVHLVSTGISWSALNQIVSALRFFYGVTIGPATIPPLPWPSFAPPLSDRFIRNNNTALQQHFLDKAQAERKAKVEPNRVPDDLRREAMALVAHERGIHARASVAAGPNKPLP